MSPGTGTRLPDRRVVVTAMGLTQILAWGSSYYLPAVLAGPIAAETGWPLAWVIGGLSLGLLVAGLVSPRVGRTIGGIGGRPVLAASSILLALGLAGVGLAQNLPIYFAGWAVIGLGMGSGLYDAGFATLGTLFGRDARRAIVTLTLFGGFASTVCWPFSAFLVEQVGWRGACFAYACIHAFIALPMHLLLVPSVPRPDRAEADTQPGSDGGRPLQRKDRLLFVFLASAIALCSVISSVVSVHLLTLLQATGLSLAAAVSLGAMVGPSQVGARVIEMVFGRYYHPIWTMLGATVLVTLGLFLLLVGFPVILLALVPYGAGIGIESIARGTLPLALFGPAHYAALMGRIAMPSLLAQALSPAAGALLLAHYGAGGVLATLTGLAMLNVLLVAGVWWTGREAGLLAHRPPG